MPDPALDVPDAAARVALVPGAIELLSGPDKLPTMIRASEPPINERRFSYGFVHNVVFIAFSALVAVSKL